MRCDDWRCKLEVLKSWCALCQQGSCPLLVSMRTSIVKVPVDLTQVHPGAAANGTGAASAASAAANSLRSNLNQADECKKPKHHRSFPHWAPVYCTLQSQGAWATELQPQHSFRISGDTQIQPGYKQKTQFLSDHGYFQLVTYYHARTFYHSSWFGINLCAEFQYQGPLARPTRSKQNGVEMVHSVQYCMIQDSVWYCTIHGLVHTADWFSNLGLIHQRVPEKVQCIR